MDRRKFGRLVFQSAAALGVRSIAAPFLSACGGEGAGAALRDAASASAPDGGLDQPAFDSAVADAADAAEADAAAVKERDALIVGSGYGASVTALRLTQAGIRVTMLEMGRAWDKPGKDGKVFCSILNADERAMWMKKKLSAVVQTIYGLSTSFDVPYSTGALDVLGPDTMQVYCGRGLGGGSIVNLAMYVKPEREVFERVFPEVNADEMFDTFYPRALDAIGVSEISDTYLANGEGHRYSRVACEQFKAAGIESFKIPSAYSFSYMEREERNEVPRSALAFEAMFGNNYGKRSLDQSYLAEAMGTGLLTVHTLTAVRRIRHSEDGSYVLEAEALEEDGSVREQRTFTTRRLFLGGGSMGTSELLVRARESGALPDLNRHVGTQWGPNSDVFVARNSPLLQPTGSLQSLVPATGMRARDRNGKVVFCMHLPVPTGFENNTSFDIVMTESPEAGHFTYDAETDAVSLVWKDGQNSPALQSALDVIDKVNAANGTDYRTDLFNGRPFGDRATYHPVGGCPLGKATDDYGRVVGYPGLYVVDGSLIPVGIGANPSLTITALAERNVKRVLAQDFG
jgi:cholesterol oxidase